MQKNSIVHPYPTPVFLFCFILFAYLVQKTAGMGATSLTRFRKEYSSLDIDLYYKQREVRELKVVIDRIEVENRALRDRVQQMENHPQN